jgi:hypothetical protein
VDAVLAVELPFPVPAVVVACSCSCRCCSCCCRRLFLFLPLLFLLSPLPVLAVILSAAKDPEELPSPKPLEPFSRYVHTSSAPRLL